MPLGIYTAAPAIMQQGQIDRLEAELAKQKEEDELRFASLEQRLLAMETPMN